MRFWDFSDLVPLCLEQPRSAEVRARHGDDQLMVVWWGSTIECASAIAQRHREGHLDGRQQAQARRLLTALGASWFEVQPSDALREQALRILRLHPLRAADAMQLGAALEWSGSPATGGFITFDERLGAAAQREGFTTE